MIAIPTDEEQRALAVVRHTSQNGPSPRQVVVWDIVEGFQPGHTAKGDPLAALNYIRDCASHQRWVFVLLDFNRYFEQAQVARALRNTAETLRSEKKTIVLLAPALSIPRDLTETITVLDFPLPSGVEVDAELRQLVSEDRIRLDETSRDALIQACRGLGMQRVRQVIARAMAQKGSIEPPDIALVLEEKKEKIRQTEVLEFYPSHETMADVGGLNQLKMWLNLRAAAFTERARRYGLPYPRGVLLVGIQGTGKSLCAKAVAQLWRLPLLKLDVGRLMGSLVGESEARAREMIRLAEAMAPAILWLDEIDKAFATAPGGGGDGGANARVLSTLITWMQEKESPVFIVATANRIEMLPPELLRKGRFDEIFFLGLPTAQERREIFEVHLRRVRPGNVRNYQIDRLVAVSGGYSGAEIAQAIVEAMYAAFAQEREFTTDDIMSALRASVPLSRTAQDQIDHLKQWATHGRARLASEETAHSFLSGEQHDT